MSAGRKARTRRVLFGGLIASLCLGALDIVVALAVGRSGDTFAEVLFSAGALALYSIVAILADNVSDRARALTFATYATCCIGVAVAVVAIWTSWDAGDEPVNLVAAAIAVVAASEAHASYLIHRRRPTDGRAVTVVIAATLVLIGVVGAMAAVAIVVAHDGLPDGYYRVLGIAFVLDVLGDLLLPIVRRAQRRTD